MEFITVESNRLAPFWQAPPGKPRGWNILKAPVPIFLPIGYNVGNMAYSKEQAKAEIEKLVDDFKRNKSRLQNQAEAQIKRIYFFQ